MEPSLKYPWRIDTNDRYRELVEKLIGLATAALLLPVFFARDFLGVPDTEALKDHLSCATYAAWGLLGLAIFSGIVFHYFSAKWARLAWGQPVKLFFCSTSDKVIERILELSLLICIFGFLAGVAATLFSLATNVPSP